MLTAKCYVQLLPIIMTNERLRLYPDAEDMFASLLAQAEQAERNGLSIAERLAKADPGNAGWQRDLALAYGNLASKHLEHLERWTAAGTDTAILIASRKGREIMVRLVTVVPDNVQWQKDLAWFDSVIAVLEARTKKTGRN